MEESEIEEGKGRRGKRGVGGGIGREERRRCGSKDQSFSHIHFLKHMSWSLQSLGLRGNLGSPQDWKRVIKKTRQEENEERVRRDSIKRERESL